MCGEIKREYEMLLWLSEKLPVPRVLCWAEQEGKGYLLMSRLRGKMACSREYLENSEELTYMLAEALQMLWSVPAEGCPYVNTAEEKLAQAEQRVKWGYAIYRIPSRVLLASMDSQDRQSYWNG